MALYVAVFAIVLAYLAVVAAYLALRTLAKIRRATTALTRGADGSPSLIEAAGHTAEQVESLSEHADTLDGHVEALGGRFGGLSNQLGGLTGQLGGLSGQLGGLAGELAALSGQVGQLRDRVDQLSAAGAPARGADGGVVPPADTGLGALRNIALVRYDASSELSGRRSFSLALLDEKGDGVTISALAGASDTHVTAKGVKAGASADEHELSREERRAVSAAVNGAQPGLLGRKAS